MNSIYYLLGSQLFEYERIAKEKGYIYEKRKEYRLQKEEPVLKAFFAWAEKLQINRKQSTHILRQFDRMRVFYCRYVELFNAYK